MVSSGFWIVFGSFMDRFRAAFHQFQSERIQTQPHFLDHFGRFLDDFWKIGLLWFV